MVHGDYTITYTPNLNNLVPPYYNLLSSITSTGESIVYQDWMKWINNF